MFGIGLAELAVIAVVAVFVFGPDRLPEIARQAGGLARAAKRLADSTRDQLRDELGPAYADLDLRDLDPRSFVRRQIAQIMAEEDDALPRSAKQHPPDGDWRSRDFSSKTPGRDPSRRPASGPDDSRIRR
jgi:sec-independent protein translocase protein TatB